MHAHDVDWVIIGSGFGGSVSALRLAEKGYSVLVLEQGRRWADEDFAQSSWETAKAQWVPRLGLRGIMKITPLRHVNVLTGVGVGGGSLTWANTLVRAALRRVLPPPAVGRARRLARRAGAALRDREAHARASSSRRSTGRASG